MQTAKDAREARRKRILARGPDRLAYITGDLSKQHSLKSSPVSPQEASPLLDTLQADGFRSSFDSHDAKLGSFGFSDPVTEQDENVQEPASRPQPLEAAEFAASPSDTATPVLASRSRFSVESINRVPVMPPPTSSESSQRRAPSARGGKKSSVMYVKNIIHSIDASESSRALAAAIVAVLVVLQMVLSCCGHPWGDVLAILVPRWPIGLVFLTDLTLIIGAHIIQSNSKSSEKDSGSMESNGDDQILQALDVMGRFEDLLNIGLLCKKVAGAISLDCSIYVVVIICGFSVTQSVFSCCKDF